MGRQVDQLRRQVEDTGEELNRIKNEVGVVSLEDTKSYYLNQIGNVRAQILETEAELAERGVALDFLTNRVASSASPQTASAPTNTIPSEKLSEYRSVLIRLDTQRRREAELLLAYTGEHSQVKAVRAMIVQAEGERAQLERDYPALPFSQAAFASPNQPGQQVIPGAESSLAAMTIQALKAKLEILNRHAQELQQEAMRIAEREDEITKLERKLEVDSKKYFDYATALERARVDDELSQGKIGNIKLVENAIPPYADHGKRLKLAGSLAGGGFAMALLLAFFIELYMDQSVRRPVQIERHLRVPLFLSMPRLRLNGTPRKLLPAKASPDSDGTSSNGQAAPITGDETTLYAEALRDRLMMHFQLHGLNHKPKLVGITSCGRGAGVTTLATSLAASLSETGDGSVLYVDVNPDRGASAKSFQRGRPAIGLRDALEQDTRDAAKVQDNLYMVSLADPASGKIGVIPKTLSGLVPRMKASDYDYIIFDLPPITQTSATAKVAGLLDMTFVVIESEKTQTELAKKATNLLAESRANVAAVLNKHRRYLPRRVDTDL
jgi:Mrp family chromosome partitioning ATPase